MEVRLQNERLIRVLDGLDLEKVPTTARTGEIRKKLFDLLRDRVKVDIFIPQEKLHMDSQICRPLREIFEANVMVREGLVWSDPEFLEIRKRMAICLGFEFRLERHRQFMEFLEYVRDKNGKMVMAEVHEKFPGVYNIFRNSLSEFHLREMNGRVAAEQFLTEKLKEYFGADVKAAFVRPQKKSEPRTAVSGTAVRPSRTPAPRTPRENHFPLLGRAFFLRLDGKFRLLFPGVPVEKGLVKCVLRQREAGFYFESKEAGLNFPPHEFTDEQVRSLTILLDF